MYEQLIEIGAFFNEKYFFEKKTSLKITVKHHLSEMYLLLEKAKPLSYHDAQRQPSFPLIYRVIEERKMLISKKYDNVKHSLQSENYTFSTVHSQYMVTFSTVISYFHVISLKNFFAT